MLRGGCGAEVQKWLSGHVRPRQGTEICNFGAPSPLEALHWIFCFFSSFYVQFSKMSPLKSGESSEKSSGENRVKSCHVCGCHGFFGPDTGVWELKNIYHHHPESKKRKSSEWNSGSVHPYGRYGNAEKTSKTISTIAILSPVEVIFDKRAATVEVDTLISPGSGVYRLRWLAIFFEKWYAESGHLPGGFKCEFGGGNRVRKKSVSMRKFELGELNAENCVN